METNNVPQMMMLHRHKKMLHPTKFFPMTPHTLKVQNTYRDIVQLDESADTEMKFWKLMKSTYAAKIVQRFDCNCTFNNTSTRTSYIPVIISIVSTSPLFKSLQYLLENACSLRPIRGQMASNFRCLRTSGSQG